MDRWLWAAINQLSWLSKVYIQLFIYLYPHLPFLLGITGSFRITGLEVSDGALILFRNCKMQVLQLDFVCVCVQVFNSLLTNLGGSEKKPICSCLDLEICVRIGKDTTERYQDTLLISL